MRSDLTMETKITSIKAWCPICKGEPIHVEEIVIINGSVTLKLECGHILKEHFPL